MASPYIIGDIEGFTPQIARLIGMMTVVRRTTIDAVKELSIADLDHVHDEKSNSIGALLAHIAAVELWYQINTFDLDQAPLQERKVALELGDAARREIRGRPLQEYVRDLENIRATTLAEFGKRNDQWLYEETPFYRGEQANNYFKWFHVFEDELNHRGQIRFLVKRLPR